MPVRITNAANQGVLSLVLPERQVLIAMVANGRWWLDGVVEIFLGAELLEEIPREEIDSRKDHISRTLTECMWPYRPYLYNPGRWTDNQYAVDDWGLPMALGRLAKYAYVRFACSFARPALRRMPAPDVLARLCAAMVASKDDPTMLQRGVDINWSAIHAKDRLKTTKYMMQEDPFPDIVLLRVLLHVLTDLVSEHLEIGGER